MHQALYRKWRPGTFDEVCGQEQVTEVLKYEVSRSLLSHAYLFCGSRGTGKTTCAKILAKAVNCDAPVGGNPCLKCPSCLSVASGAATDILEMDAASNNKVDDIRTVLDEVIFTPSSLKYRVYIIDEVHMLSTSAFNALLKTLEEPPAHVLFILATTEMQKLPATVISRCQRFEIRRIATSVIVKRLETIAKEEGIGLDPDAALTIARLAAGGMRDAISLFELAASKGGRVTAAAVSDAAGSSGRDLMSKTVRAVASRDCAAVIDIISSVSASSKDIGVFWQELIAYYRDMLVFRTVGRKTATDYLDLTDSETETLAADTALFSREQLLYHTRILDDTFTSMQRPGASARICAETALIRMTDERLTASYEALLSRIAALEARVSMGEAAPAAREAAAPAGQSGGAVPKARTESAPAASPEAAEGVRQVNRDKPEEPVRKEPEKQQAQGVKLDCWQDVLDILYRSNPGAAAFLTSTNAEKTEDADGITVRIFYKRDAVKQRASAPEAVAKLAEALSSQLGRPVRPDRIVFEKTGDAGKPAGGIPELDAAVAGTRS